MRKPIIVGNWKMFKNQQETIDFLQAVDKECANIAVEAGVGVPAINLAVAKQHAKNVIIAAQNCHWEKDGAFTGEISIPMLKAINVTHVIIGHSERRDMFNETDETVNKKVLALLANNMTPILCCGEPLSVYEAGQTNSYVANQITKAFANVKAEDVAKVVIAYEPIWAIGTGKTATPEIAQTVIKNIRDCVAHLYSQELANAVRIQYGGSVKPNNIKELLAQPDIDGALVGGASLEVSSFLGLVK